MNWRRKSVEPHRQNQKQGQKKLDTTTVFIAQKHFSRWNVLRGNDSKTQRHSFPYENWDRINMRKRDRNCTCWKTKTFIFQLVRFICSLSILLARALSISLARSLTLLSILKITRIFTFIFRICNFTLLFLFLFILGVLFKHTNSHKANLD